MSSTPFKISINDDAIADLRRRLAAARFPDEVDGSGFAYGMNSDYLRELVSYWGNDFDWRAQEAWLNRFNHYRATIDGLNIHYVYAKSGAADAIPLLMLHGWPSSFVQMLDIIPLLTAGKDSPGFHVVAASLPGFGFSEASTKPGMSVGKIAPLMHALMTKTLGFPKYGLRSSDLGAGVANAMALQFPDSVVGSHTGGTNPWVQGAPPDNLTTEEKKFLDDARQWMQTEMAYAQLHSSKPQTIAAALNDSPAGLAAWIGEKFWRWTDNKGRIEDAVSRDAFLTNLSIYWFTQSINASMRLYYETARDAGGWGRPTAPIGYLMPVHDMFPTPKSWIERQGLIVHWTESDRGGHFMEWEQPSITANDIHAFFKKIAKT